MGGGNNLALFFSLSSYTGQTFIRNLSTSLLAHAQSSYCLKLKYYTFETWSVVIPTWNSVPQNQGWSFEPNCFDLVAQCRNLLKDFVSWQPRDFSMINLMDVEWANTWANLPKILAFIKFRTWITDSITMSISSDSLMEWRFSLWRRHRKNFSLRIKFVRFGTWAFAFSKFAGAPSVQKVKHCF